ncbi:capsule biosynthesis protein [Reyranella sp. CPCC 100927]|uniref:capsule biosynthesis protein n=1 Tax=Reyranella sp. CPCC 100927 TaxID=2599616 RepID=UPI0011B6A465|nr:capsule biosynthesis protein [Reyranella sp. CPCC 100927]TWT12887.1 capsule biosynthesis protein [Reyranella sp. CPCC 100927]
MDGDIGQQPRARRRQERLVTDVTPASGIVARAYRSMRSLMPLRQRQLEIDAESGLAPFPTTRGRFPLVLVSFIACVVLPALAAQIYFIFIASDQYVAEAHAVVRSAEQESAVQSAMAKSGSSGAGANSTSALSMSTLGPNAYVVTNYIRSRAVVDDLAKTMDLRAIFRRPEADFWARLKSDAKVEDLVDYWKDMVTTYVDGPSGIVTVKIRAFRPDDALALTRAVLQLSEQLVNEMSDRARQDAMRFAEREVERADGRVRTALTDLRRYRDDEGLIDPIKTADETGKLLLQLLAEKIRLESDLFVASRSLTRNAPSIQNMTARLEITDVQIAQLKEKMTGQSSEIRNIAAKLSKFEELEVQRQFSERLFTMAQDGLERARMSAERQAVYLTVFVPPSLPEDSLYPRRVAFSILAPLALFVVWSIVALIWASVEDHRV